MEQHPIEQHPLKPFLPERAKILMLGSFPPQEKRWSISFYYPNLQNDMWRIMGLIFHHDKNYFVNIPEKKFKKELIIDFLTKKGIALFDTATAIRRLQDNASDKFLEITTPTDIAALLRQLPECKAIVTTGQKATDIILTQFETNEPKVGSSSPLHLDCREMYFYRMPSSSRAYPLAIEKKAAYYQHMFEEIGILS